MQERDVSAAVIGQQAWSRILEYQRPDDRMYAGREQQPWLLRTEPFAQRSIGDALAHQGLDSCEIQSRVVT